MESRFADVNVEGEISGLRPSGNGHVYFTLKDAQAQLDCVMFAREAARLRFRQRWAVLSAAGIYGAIAREAERLRERTLDGRITTSRAAKLGFVLRGLGDAILPPRAADAPVLSRRALAALAQENAADYAAR